MALSKTDKKRPLLEQVDQVLKLPLSEYHQLKFILRHTLEALGADRY